MPKRFLRPFVKPFLSRRFIKFGAVGATGVVVNLGCLAALRKADVHTNVASAIAIELSILSNFLINHLWTFGDRRGSNGSGPSLGQHLLKFHLVSLGGGAIQFVLFVMLNVLWLRLFGTASEIAAYAGGAGSFSQRWIWHPFVQPPEVGNWVYVSQLAGIGAATVWNYLLNFYWTWAHQKTAPTTHPTPSSLPRP
jgi:putative flippase GtrA